MLTKEKIERINELSRKSKTEGLSEAELLEQAELRKQYLVKFRENFKGHLDRIKFVDDIEENKQNK